MRRRQEWSIEIKTPAQIALMREAGLVVASGAAGAAAAVEPGITTADLDAIAERVIRARRRDPVVPRATTAIPRRSAPRSTTRSCTASPLRRRAGDGDLISIDCGAIVDGWHGDAAVTVGVGAVRPELAAPAGRLRAVAVARPRRAPSRAPGSPTSRTPSRPPRGRPAAYGIVEDYGGHGIGTAMHMDPQVPNYGRPGRGPVLTGHGAGDRADAHPGRQDTDVLDDGWTVVTADGSLGRALGAHRRDHRRTAPGC